MGSLASLNHSFFGESGQRKRKELSFVLYVAGQMYAPLSTKSHMLLGCRCVGVERIVWGLISQRLYTTDPQVDGTQESMKMRYIPLRGITTGENFTDIF